MKTFEGGTRAVEAALGKMGLGYTLVAIGEYEAVVDFATCQEDVTRRWTEEDVEYLQTKLNEVLTDYPARAEVRAAGNRIKIKMEDRS